MRIFAAGSKKPTPLGWPAGLGILVALACGCSDRPRETSEDWNVLLVTLDTTRADRLGCYGYDKALTPYLDALAQEGIRFENAYATASLSPVSHASILTGRNNYSHGLRVAHGELGHRLPEDVPSLAEILGNRGWRTAAFVSSYAVSTAYGLDRGYQLFQSGLGPAAGKMDGTRPQEPASHLRDGRLNATQRRSDATTDGALTWLEEHGEQGPWHLWVHYFDVHDASLVPPLALATAAGIAYDPSIAPDDLAQRELMYDFELGYMDRQFGRLIEYLKRSGQFNQTVIIVVADHGLGLSEGKQNHGWSRGRLLYDWALHVPLIVKLPEQPRGLVVNNLVRTIDVLPTLLEQVDLFPPGGIEGRSLLPILRGELDEPRVAYADALNLEDTHSPGQRLPEHQNDNLYVALGLRWKLIHHHREPEFSELYDRLNDPLELTNLYREQPNIASRLLRVLTDQKVFRTRKDPATGPTADTDAPQEQGSE